MMYLLPHSASDGMTAVGRTEGVTATVEMHDGLRLHVMNRKDRVSNQTK